MFKLLLNICICMQLKMIQVGKVKFMLMYGDSKFGNFFVQVVYKEMYGVYIENYCLI